MRVVLVFLVLNALATNEQLNRFFRLLVYLAIATSLIAFAQVVLFHIVGTNYSFAATDVNRVFSSPLGLQPRVTALTSHPNLLGTNLSVPFIFLLYSLISPEAVPKKSRMIIFLILTLMLIPLFFSSSRGTWLALAIGLGAIYFLKRPRLVIHKITLLLGIVMLSYITGLLSFAYNLAYEINPHSVSARVGLFKLGLDALASYSLIGYGYGTFSGYSGNIWGLSVHSFPLQVLSETGILGFITYMAMIVYVFKRAGGQLMRTRFPRNRLMLEAYLASFICVLVNNMFHQVAWSNFTFIIMALGEAITRIVEKREESGSDMKLVTDSTT